MTCGEHIGPATAVTSLLEGKAVRVSGRWFVIRNGVLCDLRRLDGEWVTTYGGRLDVMELLDCHNMRVMDLDLLTGGDL